MKKIISLAAVAILMTTALFCSCGKKDEPDLDNQTTNQDIPILEDTTKFTSSSIEGIWACVGSDNKTLDLFTGEYEYHWDYDPNADTYDVEWYFNIQNNSRLQYVNLIDGKQGEYRRSDGYLHIAKDSEWEAIIDADYIYDEDHQAIRCTSGEVFGIPIVSVKAVLGSDTVFYVERQGLNEAKILDNTGYLQSQYVIRVKGIKNDL